MSVEKNGNMWAKTVMKHKELSSVKFEDISIPGLKTVCSDRDHTARRIFWGLTLAVSSIIGMKFVYDCTSHYLKNPITVNVQMRRADSLEFPVITVCNKNEYNLTALNLLWDRYENETGGVRSQDLSVLVGFVGSAKKFDQLTAHSLDFMMYEVSEVLG